MERRKKIMAGGQGIGQKKILRPRVETAPKVTRMEGEREAFAAID